jgi:fido (protein-threonine AMPylation protein)
MATQITDADAIVNHATRLLNQRAREIYPLGHIVDPRARSLALLDELHRKLNQEFDDLLTVAGSHRPTRAWQGSLTNVSRYQKREAVARDA